MASKHPIQIPGFTNHQAHLYIACGDVVCGLRPPCCTSCPRLPQMATGIHQFKHQTIPQFKPPNSDPSTLSVEVAHNEKGPAMRHQNGAPTPAITNNNQPNTGVPSWPSTI